MLTTIKCKYCGKEIEISEALQHEIQEETLAIVETRHQKELEEVKRKAKELNTIELKDQEEHIKELEQRTQKAEEEELKIRKEKRQLQEDKEKFEIEKLRQLDEERDKIIKQARETAEEKDRLKIAEYEKKLRDMSEDLKKAQAKSEQGSQQLQGEVLELDLEKALAVTCPDDEIIPVGKGAKGGDIIQKVRGKSGRIAGLILWETKRAQWSPSWLAKLREDARKEDASIAVLVSTKLPTNVDNFKLEREVIICQYHYALPLAGVLRRSILQIAVAKQTAESKDENLELLYQYLQSEAFRHRFEAFAEGIVQMQEDLESEKRSIERVWKRRETQIKKTLINVSRIYGELQGTMGNALPDIKVLSLPDADKS
ncbi:DUF2130 domain-containing protein [Patescibacteria group bacterium]|nr:DUF2130 domain-containing protein [Patescibacteria group bacterium]